MSKFGERIAAWFSRQKSYVPPEGRLSQDPLQRLPSGGQIQRMPGDGIDPLTPNPQTGRNP